MANDRGSSPKTSIDVSVVVSADLKAAFRSCAAIRLSKLNGRSENQVRTADKGYWSDFVNVATSA